MTTITGRNGAIAFGPGLPVLLVNDQLRVIDQRPEVLADLREGRLERLIDLAHFGHTRGTRVVDILLAHYDLDERIVLPAAAKAVHEAIGCPISLDSRSPQALAAALEAMRPYKCLVNSVTAEGEALRQLLPVAAEFGAAIVAMPTGEDEPLPMTVEKRLQNSARIIDEAGRYGIPREDVVVDAILLAASAAPGSMQVTLDTLKALHAELGVATILGVGNAGFGMPEQLVIDLAFLMAAVPWGLDSALVDPATPHLLACTQAIDFLSGRDPVGSSIIGRCRPRRSSRRPRRRSQQG